MGRWIELKDKEGNVICETTPYPLLLCVRYLPNHARSEFPVLNDLELTSDKWIDELKILTKEKAHKLKKELQKVRNITRFIDFISGVDNKEFYEYWRRGENPTEFIDFIRW